MFKWCQNKWRTMSLQFSVDVPCEIISLEITNSSQCSYWLILSISTFKLSTSFCKVEISSFKSEIKSFTSSLKSFIFEIRSLFSFFRHSKSEVITWTISYTLETIFNTWLCRKSISCLDCIAVVNEKMVNHRQFIPRGNRHV